ncbi:MAG: DUF7793 family protein [Acidimicrobiales bacterium]
MANESTEFDHPKFRMWLRPDGIVQLVWAPTRELRLEDAVASIKALSTLTGGQRAPLLVDASALGSQDRAARNEFVSHGDLVSSVALIVTTPLSRVMGNFFVAVSKPMVETRLFEDEGAAIAWLKGHTP